MPRAVRVLPASLPRRRGPGRPSGTLDQSVNEAIVNLAVHHIVAVRRKRGGEIVQIKHVSAGWLTVKEYYQRQKIHEILSNPLIGQLIRSGYELKTRIWSSVINIEIFGTGVGIPTGAFLVALEFFEVEYLVTKYINPAQSALAVDQANIAADQAEIQTILANIIPTGSGRKHHQRGPGGGWTQEEADAAIAVLNADIQTNQQDAVNQQNIINSAYWQVAYLVLADVLPFGDLYLMYHYGMLLYNLATGAVDDLEKFFFGTGTVVDVGGGWHFSSLSTTAGEYAQVFEQIGQWFESL